MHYKRDLIEVLSILLAVTKVGDVFTLTKSSSLYYRILELDKSSNYAKIELICAYDVDNWDENWTLSSIEEGFKEGDYKLVK